MNQGLYLAPVNFGKLSHVTSRCSLSLSHKLRVGAEVCKCDHRVLDRILIIVVASMLAIGFDRSQHVDRDLHVN